MKRQLNQNINNSNNNNTTNNQSQLLSILLEERKPLFVNCKRDGNTMHKPDLSMYKDEGSTFPSNVRFST